MRIQIRNGCRSVLCGVVLASGIASAQLAGPSGPAQASAEAERDALLTANATDAPVWVTLYERGARSGEECFRPGHGKLWVFRQPRGALRVQAQLAPNCVWPASAPAPGSTRHGSRRRWHSSACRRASCSDRVISP